MTLLGFQSRRELEAYREGFLVLGRDVREDGTPRSLFAVLRTRRYAIRARFAPGAFPSPIRVDSLGPCGRGEDLEVYTRRERGLV